MICTFGNLAYPHIIGCNEKDPSVRYNMGLEQLKSVPRTLVHDSKLNHFPSFLSLIILIAALFGEESINVDCFIDGLKQHVSKLVQLLQGAKGK